MKRLLIAATLAGSLTNAFAADLPQRVPMKALAPASVYDWTGFYAGLNLGIGVGGEGRSSFAIGAPVNSFERFNLASVGVIGGGQAGYNYQIGQFVLGGEADIQGRSNESNLNCILGCGGAEFTRISQDISWFGTVRGRVGYATGPILNYFTAGFAYGGVRTQLRERLGGAEIAPMNWDRTRTGYTLGSGIEAALDGNWTGRIEYLYVDLGRQTDSFVAGGVPQVLSTEARQSVFRAAVNYRFGDGRRMLAAASTANWTGFYAGVNAGSGIARDSTAHTTGILNNQFDLAPRGFNGGLQAGYNWQYARWVYGLEGDFQGSTQLTDRSCLGNCTAASTLAFRQKLEWFGTGRGRLGYGVGESLFYITGGLAYGRVSTRIRENIPPVNDISTFTDTRAGYAAGAGIETPLEIFDWLPKGRWSVKSEYLYVDLGRTNNLYNLGGTQHGLSTEEANHIFRTGVNYRFGAPVIAKY